MARGFFERLKRALSRTRAKLAGSLKTILPFGRHLDKDAVDEIVDALVAADIGPRAAMQIAEDLREAFEAKEFADGDGMLAYLKEDMKKGLRGWEADIRFAESGPTVIVVTGVNGAGKTTTIAKLARMFLDQGRTVLLAAGDTFRAAAIEQLQIWARRLDIGIICHQSGGDPAAVAFDAVDAAAARKMDVLIVDTAGRLHTKDNLMRELGKIVRVIGKKMPGAPHEVLLVLDATTGQNAVTQAALFREVVGVTGIVLAKMDGTAKGGVVIGMRDRVDIPVKFIGIGEKAEDLTPFDPDEFVEALFAE